MIIGIVTSIAVIGFELTIVCVAKHPKEKDTSIKWELKHSYVDYLD